MTRLPSAIWYYTPFSEQKIVMLCWAALKGPFNYIKALSYADTRSSYFTAAPKFVRIVSAVFGSCGMHWFMNLVMHPIHSRQKHGNIFIDKIIVSWSPTSWPHNLQNSMRNFLWQCKLWHRFVYLFSFQSLNSTNVKPAPFSYCAFRYFKDCCKLQFSRIKLKKINCH